MLNFVNFRKTEILLHDLILMPSRWSAVKHLSSPMCVSVLSLVVTLFQEKSFVSVHEVAEREAISELLDASQQKLKYVQDMIQESQSALVQMDEGSKVCL